MFVANLFFSIKGSHILLAFMHCLKSRDNVQIKNNRLITVSIPGIGEMALSAYCRCYFA